MPQDITEDLPYDLTHEVADDTLFTPSNIAYDISFDNLPFMLKISNQDPYRRETAQYRKDQFDNSNEPGEQSLSGWWIRSQTSWHNGSGIKFYEPGTDYQHVSHRFKDSRGVDVWTVGEASLLPEVFHAYTGTAGINAATGRNGSSDCLVSGDSNGVLKRVTLNGDTTATTGNFVKTATSYPDGHSGSNYPFYSVTTDGSTYYAMCSRCIHKGTIGTLASDAVFFKHSATDTANAFIKYAKGYVLAGTGATIGVLDTTAAATSGTHTTGAADTMSNKKVHINSSWVWNDATAGTNAVYVSGNGGNNGEVWQVLFDDTATVNALDMAGATMVLSLPDGETVNSIHYYLGFLAVGTNAGIRICPVTATANGSYVTMGPLLIELDNATNGFAEKGSYLYAATSALEENGAYTHGVLIRIDLSQQFDDGTFAYAYDLEYRSSVNTEGEAPFTATNSVFNEVYVLDDRLVCVVEEDGSGELQVEHSTRKRDTGWLETGQIRYGTSEPKFFKYIKLNGDISSDDSVDINTITENGTSYDLFSAGIEQINTEVGIISPSSKQETLGFKFTLNNNSPYTNTPKITSYQVKAIPASKRQRMYQYPLSCFNTELDRFNVEFGYSGRAFELLTLMEQLEENGDLITVQDYRTNERFSGVIEEVRFTNESSTDKDDAGYGGLLLVTVRKM